MWHSISLLKPPLSAPPSLWELLTPVLGVPSSAISGGRGRLPLGPLLFLLFTLSWMISPTSFIALTFFGMMNSSCFSLLLTFRILCIIAAEWVHFRALTFSEVQRVQRETLYFISNLDAFPQMFSISVVTTDAPLVPKTRELVTKGLSENDSLPWRCGQGWDLRKLPETRGGGQPLHQVWAGERRRASPEPGRRRIWKEGMPKSLVPARLHQTKMQPLPVECDLILGGLFSIMERTPSTSASLSHAFQTTCLTFLLTMVRFCIPSAKCHSEWGLITVSWYTQPGSVSCAMNLQKEKWF